MSVERFAEIADLFDVMIALKRSNLRRRHPELTERQLRKRIDAWLLAAEPLDPAHFVKVSWEERMARKKAR